MLVRFNIGNFLSFKEIQEISLLKGKTKSKSNRIFDNDKIKLLKFASVFGANASGKSNLISSMIYAQNTVTQGMQKKGKNLTFKLDESYKNKPSYFEFEILIDNKSYSYGFEILLDKNEFTSEWLLELSSSGIDKNIFTRNITDGIITTDLTIKQKGLQTKFDVYSDDIKNNKELLFLTEMNRAKSELYKTESALSIFRKIFLWIEHSFDVNYPDRPISDYSYFRDVDNKDEICRVIKALGTGITNFNVVDSSLEQIQKTLPKEIFEKLQSDLKDMNAAKERGKKLPSISIRTNDMYYVISMSKKGDIQITTIVFNHGNDVTFDFAEESDGTKRILDLVEILFSANDKTYIIDEIDRSLHPQLTYKFIEEFLALANKRNTQLLITTHESRLLDFGLLRQDEIWIANKNEGGETELYSLDEYNVRFDKKVDKAYLEGRYGGVPIFSTIFPIQEDELNENTKKIW